MRLLSLTLAALCAALYGAGALYFYAQERSARSSSERAGIAAADLQHPEALLEVASDSLGENDFSERPLSYLRRALEGLPSFYQPAYLLAAYHGNRFEQPERTHRAFLAALRRYPANGRLHFAYAQWLLGSGAAHSDPEAHLRTALRLEPELTAQALAIARRQGIPPERWTALMPGGPDAARELALAFRRAGREAQALNALRAMLPGLSDPSAFRDAASWALEWGQPDVALEVAQRWQQLEDERGRGSDTIGPGLLTARIHLVRGDLQAADAVFRATRERAETILGPSSLPVLELLCALGYEHLSRGRTALAESLFAEAAVLAPAHAPALLGLARTYSQRRQTASAIEQYERLLRLEPGNAEAELELGQLLLEMGSGAR
jgi:Tfp pilus assembly protein PilF